MHAREGSGCTCTCKCTCTCTCTCHACACSARLAVAGDAEAAAWRVDCGLGIPTVLRRAAEVDQVPPHLAYAGHMQGTCTFRVHAHANANAHAHAHAHAHGACTCTCNMHMHMPGGCRVHAELDQEPRIRSQGVEQLPPHRVHVHVHVTRVRTHAHAPWRPRVAAPRAAVRGLSLIHI